MAHIRKLDANRWQARYRGPDGREHARNFSRKVDAERFLTTVEGAKLRGDYIDPALARTPVHDWRAQHDQTTSVRPSTRATIDDYWRLYIGPWFDDLPIGTVDHVAVLSWLADLDGRDLSAATRNKALQTLNKVMGAAVDAGLITRNPCARVPHPKVSAGRCGSSRPTRSRAWPTRSTLATAPGSSSAPTRARVRARPRPSVGRVSTSSAAESRSPRRSSTSAVGCTSVPPRRERVIGRSRSRGRSSARSRSTWARGADPTSSSPHRREDLFDWVSSDAASGIRRPARPGWTACVRTTSDTPPSPYGSRPGRHRGRSRHVRGTRPSSRSWTAMGTSYRS